MKRILAAVVAAMMLLCAMPVGVGARATDASSVMLIMIDNRDECEKDSTIEPECGVAIVELDEDGMPLINSLDYYCFIGEGYCDCDWSLDEATQTCELILHPHQMACSLDEGETQTQEKKTGIICSESGVTFDNANVFATVIVNTEIFRQSQSAAAVSDGGDSEPNGIEQLEEMLTVANIIVKGSSSMEMLFAYGTDVTITCDKEAELNIANDEETVDNVTEIVSWLDIALSGSDKEDLLSYTLIVFMYSYMYMQNYSGIGAVNLVVSSLDIDKLTVNVHGADYDMVGATAVRLGDSDSNTLKEFAIGLAAMSSIINVGSGMLNVVADSAKWVSVGISATALPIDENIPFFTLPFTIPSTITVSDKGILEASAGTSEDCSFGVMLGMPLSGPSNGDDIPKAMGVLNLEGGKFVAEAAEAADPEELESIGLVAYICDVNIAEEAEVVLKGCDMAMMVLPTKFHIDETSTGEYAEEYDATEYTEFDDGYLENWNTIFNYENSTMDDVEEECIKYKYIHLNGPDKEDPIEDDDPAGFNLFLLMLMMAQIDVEITGEGTVTHDGNTRMAYFNKPRTFTITPAEGWEIADVLYEGESLGAVDTVEIIPTVRKSLLEVIFTEIPADDAE